MKILLDSVPDNVIICSRGNKKRPAKALYANLRTTTFFGSDVVNYRTNQKKKSMLKAVKIDGVVPSSSSETLNPIRMKIFS